MNDFTLSYLETALWSEVVLLPVPEDELVDSCMDVDEDHPLYGISECDHYDDHFTTNDIDEESLKKAEEDCDKFINILHNKGLYEKALEYADDDRIAHDFWLSRNGHGAGFWDGDYGEVGNLITDICREFGEVDILVDNNGKIFFHLTNGRRSVCLYCRRHFYTS